MPSTEALVRMNRERSAKDPAEARIVSRSREVTGRRMRDIGCIAASAADG